MFKAAQFKQHILINLDNKNLHFISFEKYLPKKTHMTDVRH